MAGPTTTTTPVVTVPHKIVIRSWPKMIFMLPTAVAALILGIATSAFDGYANAFGGIFMIIFGLNLMILTFDFPRGSSLMLIVSVIAALLALFLLNQTINLIPPITNFFKSRQISASPEFYYFFVLIYAILAIAMYIQTRFDYWELEANEIIHHTGILGDIERFPTAGVKFNKEIVDVFEYIILGAGRLVLVIPSAPRPFVLDNILQINKLADLADRIMEARSVRIESQVVTNQMQAGQQFQAKIDAEP